jgi:acetyl-CoA carboxylase biotin carboxyl carrier protein
VSEHLEARLLRVEGRLELRSPVVGHWREAPTVGAILRAGDRMGAIEILGRVQSLTVPPEAHGVVVEALDDDRARRPVDYGAFLLALDPSAGLHTRATAAEATAGEASESPGGRLVFSAPSSGRFYSRASPDKPPFVVVGAFVEPGQTVGLLEVMKTFTRLNYNGGGATGLPERARVLEIIPGDDTDLAAGDPILRLEDADGDDGPG